MAKRKFRKGPGFFDTAMLFMVLLAVGSAGACWLFLGEDAVYESMESDFQLVLSVAPKLGLALLIAGFVQTLVPRDIVARFLGEQAGLKGVTLATGLGFVTPGGPMTSFPMVNALYDAGTGRGALIAYLTAWSTLGFQRILVWEIPLLGMEFAILRQVASIPLPFIAALISARLPRDLPQDHAKGPAKK
jgi:uncharacterized membrane protein YraQ (UPF0718 family)